MIVSSALVQEGNSKLSSSKLQSSANNSMTMGLGLAPVNVPRQGEIVTAQGMGACQGNLIDSDVTLGGEGNNVNSADLNKVLAPAIERATVPVQTLVMTQALVGGPTTHSNGDSNKETVTGDLKLSTNPNKFMIGPATS